jgi:hypothetical protein
MASKMSKKLQGAKSGEHGGWLTFIMDFLARNLWPLNTSCSWALPWLRIHLFRSFPLNRFL